MKRNDWFRTRSYLHFDAKIYESQRPEVEQKVSDPKAIASHGFLPFLKYEKKLPKFATDSLTGKRFSKTKTREICYASHWDAQIYSYYSFILNELYEQKLAENGLTENVIAFRKIKDQNGNSKSNMHFAGDAFNEIGELKNCKVFAFDITKFFDSLDSVELKKQWCNILNVQTLPEDHYAVFRSVTKFSFIERDSILEKFRISKDPRKQRNLKRICDIQEFRDTIKKENMISVRKKGIPQGSPISATLANIYMLEFDKSVSNAIEKQRGKYYRYCDDIFIVVPLATAVDVPHFVNNEIQKYGLSLNTNKTDEAIFYEDNGELKCDKGIQYLGFIFDGVSISLRPGAISTYKRKVKKAVSRAIAIKLTRDGDNEKLGLPPTKLRLKKIIRDYSHIGKMNFITYGRRSQEILGSEAIRLQLADLHRFLEKEVARAKTIGSEN